MRADSERNFRKITKKFSKKIWGGNSKEAPFLVVFFRYGKKITYVVTRDVCPSVRLSVVCGNIFGTQLHYN